MALKPLFVEDSRSSFYNVRDGCLHNGKDPFQIAVKPTQPEHKQGSYLTNTSKRREKLSSHEVI